MFRAVEHDKFQESLLSKQSLAYKKQKSEEFLQKIEKLNGKIAVLEAKKIKTASNLLQLTSLKQELEATEDLMEKLLSGGQGDIEDGNALGSDITNKYTPQQTRDDLIRKGVLNPLDNQSEQDPEDHVDNSSDIFLYDKSEHKDYLDDGVEEYYRQRYFKYVLERYKQRTGNQDTPSVDVLKKEEFISIDKSGDHDVGRLTIPSEIYRHLFEYQKTCLRWFYELYNQQVGGVLGDGLGKTVQVIGFLGGMRFSKLIDGPVLVVCPATVLRQWVQEFHKWYPAFRVVILHSSGSALGGNGYAYDSDDGDMVVSDDDDFIDDSDEEALMTSDEDEVHEKKRKFKTKPIKRRKRPAPSSISRPKVVKELVNSIVNSPNPEVIITTYSSIRIYKSYLLPVHWGYAILDEGHKIRNPDADVTITCKQLQTNNRIILSGTPIQNNLPELWSLYDFVYPGRLGTLPVFKTQFDIPIRMGGYANASSIQVQTAFKCASVLKDFISPYLLRRLKADVAQQLPKKNEQILFCKLTRFQKNRYERYLDSDECSKVVSGQIQTFKGIDTLRKICNHPDLLVRRDKLGSDYGNVDRSGKMLVVIKLLKIWQEQGHKALLFTQTRQMLDIIEAYVRDKYSYSRMDGNTPIQNRAKMVDDFNSSSTFLFLLTTKVGGLGINLTGANRIIIFDPDWNPSTDMQARERAWRLGQTKPVTIYRLLISGSIEEKIYHRQIYKQFLTNKVLVDPRQERFFKSNDLSDLFTLDVRDNDTETADMFSGSKVVIEEGVNVDGAEDYGVDEGGGGDDDSRILQALVGDGIHSALQHDMIMGASNPEQKIIDRESRLVAQQAVEALRKSRSTVRKAAAFQPTWTGKSGDAGKPGSGGSSSKLLQGLRQKSGMAPKTGDANTERMARDLRDFLARGEIVSSKLIMEHFKIEGNSQVLKLRTMLREIADFKDSDSGKGWLLKPEFE